MNMEQQSVSPIRHPTAWIPLAMSYAAVTMVLVHVAKFGIVHEADEGTAAHMFQFLLILQLPIVVVFAFTWIPKLPSKALPVLLLQACAGFTAVAAAYWLT